MAMRLSPQAQADLVDIWTYLSIESGRQSLADSVVDATLRACLLIDEHPRIGRARDTDLGRGRRSFATKTYVIVYEIEEDDVHILRIVHGRRDLPALFGWRDE